MKARMLALVVWAFTLLAGTPASSTAPAQWRVLVQHRTSPTDDNPTMTTRRAASGDKVTTQLGVQCEISARRGHGSLICEAPGTSFITVVEGPKGGTVKFTSKATKANDSVSLLDESEALPATNAPEVWTLYRTSPITNGEQERIHVATYDADERGRYNQTNCSIVGNLMQSQPGVTVRYWCEQGRYRKTR